MNNTVLLKLLKGSREDFHLAMEFIIKKDNHKLIDKFIGEPYFGKELSFSNNKLLVYILGKKIYILTSRDLTGDKSGLYRYPRPLETLLANHPSIKKIEPNIYELL